MFDVDEFVIQVRAALAQHTPQLAVKELVARVVADPGPVATSLGPAETAGLTTLYRGDDLTILRVIWAPGMTLFPHEHRMWAVIGLYGGEEQNAFFRRDPAGLQRSGGKDLARRDTVLLGEDVIHAVTNPRSVPAEAIHIYGGDFFATPRSEWDPTTLEEREFSVDNALRAFAEANARWAQERAASR
jgi:predicted metal-dependent enzyme (double-stranded beta helix superfamily)